MFSILALPFPEIDPVALALGPLAIRWYSLAYILGLLLGWWYVGTLNKRQTPPTLSEPAMQDILTWAILGVILGGRLGYVLFYQFGYYLEHPQDILKVWQGGMSVHGGAIGVICAFLYFTWRKALPKVSTGDMVALGLAPGLLLGRIANFINAELWGRPTDLPWGVVFPTEAAQFCPDIVGLCARHPSQLYEAILEGFVLFAILWVYSSKPRPHLAVSGMFLLFYGIFRFAIEFVRVPDAEPGYIAFGWVTMGQVLSAPMILLGAGLIVAAYRHKKAAE